jgi:hypothetical protein
MAPGTSGTKATASRLSLMAGFHPAGLRGCPSTTNGWDPFTYPVLPSVKRFRRSRVVSVSHTGVSPTMPTLSNVFCYPDDL